MIPSIPTIIKPGDARSVRRSFEGALLDVAHAAEFLGCTEKTLRARVSRKLVPCRRFSGRIVFVRTELEQYIRSLPGVTLEEARANLAMRQGVTKA